MGPSKDNAVVACWRSGLEIKIDGRVCKTHVGACNPWHRYFTHEFLIKRPGLGAGMYPPRVCGIEPLYQTSRRDEKRSDNKNSASQDLEGRLLAWLAAC